MQPQIVWYVAPNPTPYEILGPLASCGGHVTPDRVVAPACSSTHAAAGPARPSSSHLPTSDRPSQPARSQLPSDEIFVCIRHKVSVSRPSQRDTVAAVIARFVSMCPQRPQPTPPPPRPALPHRQIAAWPAVGWAAPPICCFHPA